MKEEPQENVDIEDVADGQPCIEMVPCDVDLNIRPQFVGFLVSHQVLYLHTMRAGGYYHYVFNRYFSPKNSTNIMPGGLALVIHYCRRALVDGVQ